MSPCLFSMALKGFRQPLVQEDMWDLNERDSTADINKNFQHFMQLELARARVSYQKKKAQDRIRDKSNDEDHRNGLSTRLGKGISQDVLMMVKIFRSTGLLNSHMCSKLC